MLRVEHVVKSFSATRAVDDVSFTLDSGDIVGLLGENGAGKTTLMRIVAGEIAPDSGTIETPPRTGIVHQHFAVVPHFTIAENLALVRERSLRFATRRTIEREAEETIRATGIELHDVWRRAGELSVGERAKLELIKAVASSPELLILDEPTSVLTPLESEELFALVRRMNATVVFITHKIPEVLQVAQRFVVMRKGRVVLDTREKMSAEDLATAMVGVATRDLARRVAAPGSAAATRIRAIVGVAGNGQGELAERARAEARGRVGFIPEDRTRDALVGDMTIAENIGLALPRWNPSNARRIAESLIALYNIKARGPMQLARELSGGNQQKVVLARELDRKPGLIVAMEPTRGLDIESGRFVHEQLRNAAAAGAEILLITSDLDEAFALADRIQVIYRGRLSDPMTPEQAAGKVANLMAGVA